MNIMNNYSAIAGLMLFGLFLITCPAAGFVAGYRYIDLSDSRLQSSPWKRQGYLSDREIMALQATADRIQEEMAHNGEFPFEPPGAVDIPTRPRHYRYPNIADPNKGEITTEDQDRITEKK